MKNSEFVQTFLDSILVDEFPSEDKSCVSFADVKNTRKDICYVNIDYANAIEKMKSLLLREVNK